MFSIIGVDGKEYGPVPTATIQEWMAAGRVNLATKACRAGETAWRTLADFPEFNPAAAAVPAGVTPVPAPTLPPAAPIPAAVIDTTPLATRLSRLGAALLDMTFGSLLLAPGFVAIGVAGAFAQGRNPNTPLLLAGFGLLGVAALALVGLQIYLVSTRGQTVGKILVHIKIVDFETGQNAGFVKAFLLRSFVNGLIGAVPVLGSIYSLVDLCFIFRGDQRCIHDLIANTKVVKA